LPWALQLECSGHYFYFDIVAANTINRKSDNNQFFPFFIEAIR
jgi:hypothetical protein